MSYSTQFVQELTSKDQGTTFWAKAKLAWSDFISLKRESSREHKFIPLLARFHLACEEKPSHLSEIYYLKRVLCWEQRKIHSQFAPQFS